MNGSFSWSVLLPDIPQAWRQSQGHDEGSSPQPRLLDDGHRVLVSHLPVGVPPQRMKNKLTIYFQRKQNGGGEVVAITYPSAQPDQAVITFRDNRGKIHRGAHGSFIESLKSGVLNKRNSI